MDKRFAFLFLIIFTVFSGCSVEDEIQCLTVMDCSYNQQCVDGIFEKGDSGNSGNSGNTGDSGNTGNTGNTGDSGNTGDTGDSGNTAKNDACDSDPCSSISFSDGVCKEEGEDFSCGCIQGYEWSAGKCEDIDECLNDILNNCSEFAECINKTGSFECKCSSNYSGNGMQCEPDTIEVDCTNSLPENGSWSLENKDGKLAQTWSGTDWQPSTDSCKWECDTDYLLNEEKTGCYNGRKVPCTGIPANAQGSGDNADGYMTQTYSQTQGWIPDPASCTWSCVTDYALNDTSNGCINSKMVQCASENIPNSTDYPQAVAITYTTAGGWTAPAKCEWACNLDYEKNGNTCINSKLVSCTANPGKPENSYDVIANVTVTYTTSGGWSTPALCEWACNSGYKKSGAVCIVACGDSFVDAGEACDNGAQNVAPGYNFAKTCNTNCQWNPHCGDGVTNGSEVCDNATFGGKTCQTEGFAAGNLSCNVECSQISTAGCYNCPAGWDLMNHGTPRCIKVFTDGRTGDSARTQCMTFNTGRLVTIRNAAENEFVRSKIGASSWLGLMTHYARTINPTVNNSTATPFWLGNYGGVAAGNTGQSPSNNRQHYFKFTTKEAALYSFLLWGLNADLDLFLYSENCSTKITSSESLGTTTEYFFRNLSAGTTYCVRVGYSNNSSSYNVSVNYTARSEDQYKDWVSNGIDMPLYNYHNWKSGEPNNDDELCTEMYTDGFWNDKKCSTSQGYVCERNLGS